MRPSTRKSSATMVPTAPTMEVASIKMPCLSLYEMMPPTAVGGAPVGGWVGWGWVLDGYVRKRGYAA